MTDLNRSNTLIIALIMATLTLTGCGAWWLPRAHRIDIQQGNILAPAAIAQVAEGMTKIEVINILGKPITTSVFDEERWDYIYSLNKSGRKPKSKRFTVFFQDSKVYRVENEGFETAPAATG